MKTYILQTYGYTNCPEFTDKKEARRELRALAKEELNKARHNHKQARKHKLSEDCYRITLGSDKGSALWSHHCLIET